MPLNAEERAALLALARHTLEVYLASGERPKLEAASGGFMEESGAFVTLHQGDDLRGCIGSFIGEGPLQETVQNMAVAAATRDPRFPSVQADEVPGLTLEISVLSPLRHGTPEEVEVGVHGVYITRGRHRGVLLPQVASEHGWDRETFLDHTCLKAGLPPGTWRDAETHIELFTAQVFSEG